MKPLDAFYHEQPEPERSIFLVLKRYILSLDENLTEEYKYKLPFFYYKGKMCCFLWKDKKTREPYIGIANGYLINHPALEQGNRKRMKIFRINPNEDIDMPLLNTIMELVLSVQPK